MNEKKMVAAGAGLAVVAALLLSAPLLTGWKVEKTFREAVRENAKLGGGELLLLKYERGYYRSEATTHLALPPAGGMPVVFKMHHKIIHGFGLGGFNFGQIITVPEFDGEAAANLARLFGEKTPVRVTATVGLGGSVRGEVFSPAAQMTLPADEQGAGGGTVTWQGMSGQFDLKPGKRMTLELLAPAAVGPNGSAKEMSLVGDVSKGESGVWIGSSEFRLGTVTQKTDSGKDLVISGLSFGSEASEKDGVVGIGMHFGVQHVTEPEAEVRNAMVRISAGNLDAAALRSFSDLDQQVKAGEKEEALETIDRVKRLMPALMSRRPYLRIDEGGFTYNGKPASLAASLRFVGESTRAFNPLTDIEGEFEVKAPRLLVLEVLGERERRALVSGGQMSKEEAAAAGRQEGAIKVQQFVGQGLLMDLGDDRYGARFKIGNGNITVNGAPLIGPEARGF